MAASAKPSSKPIPPIKAIVPKESAVAAFSAFASCQFLSRSKKKYVPPSSSLYDQPLSPSAKVRFCAALGLPKKWSGE